MAKCEHDRERSKCKECGGGSICDHGIVRGTCSVCSPEQVFERYRYQAAKRGFNFKLTLAQFKDIVQKPCVFCGDIGSGRGIDRKNNFEGYVPGNCQACCARCNRFKSDDPEHTFLGHVRKISRHQEKIRTRESLKSDHPGSAGVAPPHTPVFPVNENHDCAFIPDNRKGSLKHAEKVEEPG